MGMKAVFSPESIMALYKEASIGQSCATDEIACFHPELNQHGNDDLDHVRRYEAQLLRSSEVLGAIAVAGGPEREDPLELRLSTEAVDWLRGRREEMSREDVGEERSLVVAIDGVLSGEGDAAAIEAWALRYTSYAVKSEADRLPESSPIRERLELIAADLEQAAA